MSTGSPTAADSTAAATETAPECHHQCDHCARHEALMCRYAGKKCRNPRATKRNGSLHNLCDLHRIRANQNQRRMSRRIRMKQDRVQASRGAKAPDTVAMESHDWNWSRPRIDPRWSQLTAAAASITAMYSMPQPPQSFRRDVSFTSSLMSDEVPIWKPDAFGASGTLAPHDSGFVDDFPWPELAPMQYESYMWSGEECVSARVMPYDSERSSVV